MPQTNKKTALGCNRARADYEVERPNKYIDSAGSARKARVLGVKKVGHCILAETTLYRDRLHMPKHILLSRLRIKEIERIIRYRHGNIVPDTTGTDDMETVTGYVMAVAGSGGEIDGWARRWLPWLNNPVLFQKAHRLAQKLASSKQGPVLLRADTVAGMIYLSMVERTALDIRTIGASDLGGPARRRAAKTAKQDRDRKRQASVRKAAGCTPHSESLSATRPWETEGISRRTWFRKRRGTNSSHIEVAMLPLKTKEATEQCQRQKAGISGQSDPHSIDANSITDRDCTDTINDKIQQGEAKRSWGLGNNSPSRITKAAGLG